MEFDIDVTGQLERFFQQKNIDFISLNALTKKEGLPKDLMTRLKINSSSPKAGDIKKRIAPYLGNRFVFLQGGRGGRTWFLSFNRSKDAMLIQVIHKTPGKSPGMLAQNFPLKKADFLSLLNTLEEQGRVHLRLNDKYEPRVYTAAEKTSSAPQSANVFPQDDALRENEFKIAFDKFNRERVFVRICDLRYRLNWPQEAFDTMLCRLRDDDKIELHTGDVASMTSKEIADSYTDENGFLMLTLTWSPA